MRRFGADDFQKVFVKFMLEAFRAPHEAGEKRRLILERIGLNTELLQQYRYPPRIFTRRPIRESRNANPFRSPD